MLKTVYFTYNKSANTHSIYGKAGESVMVLGRSTGLVYYAIDFANITIKTANL